MIQTSHPSEESYLWCRTCKAKVPSHYANLCEPKLIPHIRSFDTSAPRFGSGDVLPGGGKAVPVVLACVKLPRLVRNFTN